jgi:integrase
MVRINFNVRSPKRTGKESPINIVLRWKANTLVHPSGLRIYPAYWSMKDQRANGSYFNAAELNLNLSSFYIDIESAYLDFCQKNKRPPSKYELKEVVKKIVFPEPKERPITFFEFIQQFIDQSRTRVDSKSGKIIATNTIKKYQTTLSHLEKFAEDKKRTINFSSIDLSFYDQFSSFLTKEKGMAMNSVGKYIQTLKTFLRFAEESGMLVNQSYRSKRFRTPSELTDKIYLTVEELNDLFYLDLSQNKRLEQVRDLFIVGAWTGLRFSDFSSIRPEQITGDRIRIRTEKTGATVVIPLHPCVRAIIDKYKEHYSNSLPPAISNQKMNEYLKELAEMVESLRIPVMVSSTVAGTRKSVAKKKFELVTTHTARRSFATNMFKLNVPIRSIRAITGHRTERVFMDYVRLDSDEHADIVQLAMDKAAPMVVAK